MAEIAMLCDICGKAASRVCRLCGRRVCSTHYDTGSGSCSACRSGKSAGAKR